MSEYDKAWGEWLEGGKRDFKGHRGGSTSPLYHWEVVGEVSAQERGGAFSRVARRPEGVQQARCPGMVREVEDAVRREEQQLQVS